MVIPSNATITATTLRYGRSLQRSMIFSLILLIGFLFWMIVRTLKITTTTTTTTTTKQQNDITWSMATKSNPNFPNWNPQLVMTTTVDDKIPFPINMNEKCQRTLITPFRVGCPSMCPPPIPHPHKIKSQKTNKQPLYYRMHVAWSFGYLSNYPNDFRGQSTAFAHYFNESIYRMIHYIEKQQEQQQRPTNINTTGTLRIKPQHHMHMALAYMCCIPESYINRVNYILNEWTIHIEQQLQSHPIVVQFNKLQCWKERYNSITNIIVANDTVQSSLLSLYMDLVQYIQQQMKPYEYNPLIVPRQNQMPFHITNFGIYYNNNTKNREDGQSIDPILPIMAKLTKTITDETFVNNPDLPSIQLDFKPYVSKPKQHA